MVCLTVISLTFPRLIEFIRQFSLFVFDFLQAMGGVLDVRWAHNGIVTTGHYCTAQGIIQQIGELGVALITLVCLILLMSLGLILIDAHLTSSLLSTLS